MDRHDCGSGWSHGREWRDSASRDVPDPGPAHTRRPLTETEKRIIEHQGTEPPFSTGVVSFFEPGIYSCRKCGAPLFRSEDKFDAGCGWPCLMIPCRTPSQASMRAAGGARKSPAPAAEAILGHIFNGERLTPKNLRYCVNSFPGIPGSPSSDSGGCPPLKACGGKKYPAAFHALPDAACGGITLKSVHGPGASAGNRECRLTRKILAVSRIYLSAQPVSPCRETGGCLTFP